MSRLFDDHLLASKKIKSARPPQLREGGREGGEGREGKGEGKEGGREEGREGGDTACVFSSSAWQRPDTRRRV